VHTATLPAHAASTALTEAFSAESALSAGSKVTGTTGAAAPSLLSAAGELMLPWSGGRRLRTCILSPGDDRHRQQSHQSQRSNR
jgi:hypothetical protein